MSLSSIKIEEKNLELEGKINVCPSCLKFLALQGACKEAYIVRLDPSDLAKTVSCDICDVNEAKFFLSPFERGIQICEKDLKVREKHSWSEFQVVEKSEKLTCDICLSKGAKRIIDNSINETKDGEVKS